MVRSDGEFKVKVLDLDFGSFRFIIINASDAVERDIKANERVRILKGDRSCTAHVMISKTIISKGEVALPKNVADELKVRDGDSVGVRPVLSSKSTLHIKRKVLGDKLSQEEIRTIIKEVVDGTIGEAEIASFLTAQYFYGLTHDELEALIKAMVETGAVIEFEDKAYDEHSIGGVPGNSKVALIVVPTVAAGGLLIPKTSSRAIVSPSGTADTMEVLANVEFEPEELKRIALKTKGTIVWGGALRLAPSDDIFIRVEHRLMIDPPTQMVASILAKKLAMNISTLIIDIPVGKGAKVESMKEAEALARLFVEQASRLGMRTKCTLSYGGQPIGHCVGPALEAREALEALLTGEGAMSLIGKALSIAGLLFEEAGVARRGSGIEIAKQIFYSGKSYDKFKEIIEAQGGNPHVKPEDIPVGEHRIDIEAPEDSYVTHVDNTAITLIARVAGAPLDKGAGVKVYVKAGGKVRKGDKLLTIYAESKSKLSQAYSLAQQLQPVTLEGMILKVYPE